MGARIRAIVLNSPGDTGENMIVTDVPDVHAGEGEVVVAVAYAGCNFADTMMRRGTYPHPKGYPLVAGLEIAGRVVEVGPGVTGTKPGDRVAAFSEAAGGFAERCAIGADG
jgi:NADPH:quinone reductase